MMYPFMVLNDNTEIVHSEIKEDGRVKVYIETPDEKHCFKHATCWLPDYIWEDIEGFSDEEIKYFQDYLASIAHIIIQLAREGGFEEILSLSNAEEIVPDAEELAALRSYAAGDHSPR